ncbi:MAG TPA: hypothetical protein VGM75_36385 [Pseudonocardiaceae bacterium]
MSAEVSKRRRFVEALLAASGPGEVPLDERTATLRRELLWFGSSTPDNRDAAERLAVGEVRRWGGRKLGITLARTGSLVSDVLNQAEGCPIPDSLAEAYPDLVQEEWDAVLRLAALVLLALEGEPVDDEDQEDS